MPQKPRMEKISVETEMVDKLLPNISTGNITERNELIYAVAKLVCSPEEPDKKYDTWKEN